MTAYTRAQVRLWDDDLHDADDPLATTDVRLVAATVEANRSSGKQKAFLTGIAKKRYGVEVEIEWERIDDDEGEESSVQEL